MSYYSIKDVEQLSGIKAHTLRIWEQRYNFIKPKRTDTNIRYYDDNDLKLILNISLLRENGHKLSKICSMKNEEMSAEVIRLLDKSVSFPDQIQALTLSMLDLDEERFEKIISGNILKLGFERTMLNIIYPFFQKVGILWQIGSINPAHEHFISNMVRQKLIVAIDGQMVSTNNFHKTYLLFLPENEMHELALLFSAYLIKSRNNKLIYLGQNVPFDDLLPIYKNQKPDFMLTVITSNLVSGSTQSYLDRLSETFSDTNIIVSGNQTADNTLKFPKNIIHLKKIQELIDFLEN